MRQRSLRGLRQVLLLEAQGGQAVDAALNKHTLARAQAKALEDAPADAQVDDEPADTGKRSRQPELEEAEAAPAEEESAQVVEAAGEAKAGKKERKAKRRFR